MLEYSLALIFPFAMAFAATTDVLTMTIPNRLTSGLCAAFFVLAPVAGLGWQDVLSHMGAGSAMLLAGMLLFALGWLGGGDGKLLAVASLWLGFDQLVMFLAYVAAFGGAFALAILAYRSAPVSALPLPDWAARLHTKGEGMPYGVAIAAGALVVYPATSLFAAFTG